MKQKDIFNEVRIAFRENRMQDVLSLSEHLINSDYSPYHSSGYLFKGRAYECGGGEVEINLSRAVACYRQAAYLDPDAVTYRYLARALIKQGGDSRAAAFKYLQKASAMGETPELLLAYARYYESGTPPDYDLACKYYIKAAFYGRFQGFFGYAAILRKLRKPIRALGVDCLRILSIPLLLLLCGRRASDS